MENYRSIYDSAVLKYGPEKEETERTAANTKPALKLDDLESPDYINDIKDYMIDRKGKHMSKKKPEEIVDAFNYFFAMLIITGFNEDDLIKAFLMKDNIIRERLTNGY